MAGRGIRPLPRCDDLEVRRWLRARGSEGDREVGRISSTRRKLGRHQNTKDRYGGGSPGARAPSQLLRGCGGSGTRAGLAKAQADDRGEGERGHGNNLSAKVRRDGRTCIVCTAGTQLHGVKVRRDCARESRSMAPVEGDSDGGRQKTDAPPRPPSTDRSDDGSGAHSRPRCGLDAAHATRAKRRRR